MKKKTSYLGHRKRLRKRFNEAGLIGLSDYEQLELLLTYAVPRRDLKPIGKKLIKRLKSISGVLDAEMDELEKVDGVGSASSTLIRLVKEFCTKYLEEKMMGQNALATPESVVKFSRLKIGSLRNEALMLVLVNIKNEVIDFEITGEGSIDNVAIYPRKVVESALKKHASGIILVHNHPSGHSTPSESDIEITNDIINATKTLDIRVLDHIIVSKNGYYSFLKSGLIKGFSD